MAPRKKIDPIKAKEAKQKKIAIGGFVLLALLVAVQGPKTMKMLQGPQPAAPVAVGASTGTTAPGAGVPAPAPAAPAAGEATAAATPDLASVADSDAPPVAAGGQLVTFERFQSKDPFAQQATAAPASAGGGTTAGDGGSSVTPATAPDPTPAEPGDGPTPVDGGFTPAPAAGSGGSGSPAASPAAPGVATATSIAVNGTAQDVVVDTPFPADQPTFVLVSVAKDGKSVQLGIAGGSYASGEQTIRLVAGKPLTLQNTADGTRFVIELRSVAGFPAPKQ
jgi:hypothetical protein